MFTRPPAHSVLVEVLGGELVDFVGLVGVEHQQAGALVALHPALNHKLGIVAGDALDQWQRPLHHRLVVSLV